MWSIHNSTWTYFLDHAVYGYISRRNTLIINCMLGQQNDLRLKWEIFPVGCHNFHIISLEKSLVITGAAIVPVTKTTACRCADAVVPAWKTEFEKSWSSPIRCPGSQSPSNDAARSRTAPDHTHRTHAHTLDHTRAHTHQMLETCQRAMLDVRQQTIELIQVSHAKFQVIYPKHAVPCRILQSNFRVTSSGTILQQFWVYLVFLLSFFI